MSGEVTNFHLLDKDVAQTKAGVVKVGDRVIFERIFGQAETGYIERFFVPADSGSDAFPIAEIRQDDTPEDESPAYCSIHLIEDRDEEGPWMEPGYPYRNAASTQFSVDAEEVAKRLRTEGYERVAIEPSAISGSSYRYVYVYMTDAEYDGPHGIISDLREYEENDGYLVGAHMHYEEGAYLIDDVPTLDEAVKLLRRQLDQMLAAQG